MAIPDVARSGSVDLVDGAVARDNPLLDRTLPGEERRVRGIAYLRSYLERRLPEVGLIADLNSKIQALCEVIASLRLLNDLQNRSGSYESALQEAPISHIDRLREEFLSRYQVQELSKTSVAFVIPEGVSVLSLITEAQAIAPTLLKRDVVHPLFLERFAERAAFTKDATEELRLGVEGFEAGTINMTRAEQEDFLSLRGHRMPPIELLVAAHVVFAIKTKRDLFDDNVVRARGGSLDLDKNGLEADAFEDGDRREFIAAASLLVNW